MPFVMHVAFDNSRKLSHKVYYFVYLGTTFKLVQYSAHRFANVLLTILPSTRTDAVELAYATAARFLSSLSWENDSQITMRYAGGYGATDELSIRSARCGIFMPPIIASHTSAMRGFGIGRLPRIENDEQLAALQIWREASGSSSALLSTILYWQVLETGGTEPSSWVDKRVRAKILPADVQRHIAEIQAKGMNMGAYLENNCRHAIAHLKRKPGKPTLKLDSAEESLRIRTAALILKELARDYIRNHLGLSESLWLVGIPGKQFSEYVDEIFIKTHRSRRPNRLGTRRASGEAGVQS